MLKKILKQFLTFFIILFVGTLFITLLNYFNILNEKYISILKFILPVSDMFISAYGIGKLSNKNGYLEGLKFGSIIILIFIIIALILDKININSIIYYIILLLTSVMGSMIGINRKKTNL